MPLGNILVADDDAAIRTVLNQALSRAGYAVRLDLERRHAVALGQRGRGRPRHHRRGDAGRERLRPPAAHQAHAAGPADRRDERAEHLHDRDPRLGARRLRIPAEAVRPEGADRDRRPGAGRAAKRAAPRRGRRAGRQHPAGRPLAGDAGHLPRARAADADRPDGDDLRRVRHRQGTRRPRAPRLRQAPQRAVRRRSTWRRSRAT